jgi:hypothetical protein
MAAQLQGVVARFKLDDDGAQVVAAPVAKKRA